MILSAISILRQFWLHSHNMQLTPAEATAVFGVYILLLNIWWQSVCQRVAQQAVRKFLVIFHWLLVGWMVIRLVQSGVTAGAEQYGRFSGYLLAIPVAYGSLCNFYASLMLDKRDDARLNPRWYLLLIPATFIVIGTLTNEFHSLFYKEIPVESGPSNLYQINIGFVLTIVWLAVMELAKIRNILRRGRRIENSFKRWLPILELAGILLYTAPYAAGSFAPPKMEFIEYTVSLFFYEILVWETCIMIGVLPVNSNYREIFHRSDTGMQILRPDGSVFVRSGNADALSPQQWAELLRKDELALEDGRTLRLAPVAGGYTVWHTDMRELQHLADELLEKRETLENEDVLLRAELANQQELQRIRERQRLYHLIYEQTYSERQVILEGIGKIRTEIQAGDDAAVLERIRPWLEESCEQALVIKNVCNQLLESEYKEGSHEA